MKTLLCVIGFSMFALLQTEGSISKKVLLKMSCISELSAEVPKTIDKYSLSMVAKRKGSISIYEDPNKKDFMQNSISGCAFKAGALDFMQSADVGTKLFVEIKYTLPGNPKIFQSSLALKVLD